MQKKASNPLHFSENHPLPSGFVAYWAVLLTNGEKLLKMIDPRHIFKEVIHLAMKSVKFWLTVLFAGVLLTGCAFFSPVEESVTLETGLSSIEASQFLKENKTAQLITDVSGIDLTQPGTYTLEFQKGKSTWQSTLHLVDTTAPTATAAAQTIYSCETLQPEDFVTDVFDLTPVTVAFVTAPDFTKGGEHKVQILLTDTSGNTATVEAPLTVLVDTTFPVFSPMETLKVNLGQTVSYRKGITATDDRDGEISYTIDSSAVNLEEKGSYTIYYSATDSSGNTTKVERIVEVCSEVVINEELVNEMAQKILKKIIKEDATPHQKIEAIFNYVRKNISYKSSSDKTLLKGAYRAMTKRSGDCYNFFALSKVLLDNCGIDNLPIERDSKSSSHYWLLVNIGTGWYHFDPLAPNNAYPFKCFMKTDAQVKAYSRSRTDGKTNYYKFDESLYPERATEKYKDPGV